MSDFLYLQHDQAIARVGARRLDPPEAAVEFCAWCEMPVEDCENNVHGACLKCAHCGERRGVCPGDCADAEHLAGCPFPLETCRCAAIEKDLKARAADIATERAIDEAREDRAS